MQSELNIHDAIDGLYPSTDDVAPSWQRVAADAAVSRPRARRHAVRAVLVAAAVAAVVLGVLSALPGGGGPSSIARAASALGGGNGILHTVVVTTTKRPGGGTDVSKTETWQQTSPPYAARELGGRELAQANGMLQYYDPRTNTIQTTPRGSVPGSPRTFDESLRDRMLFLLKSGEAREDGHVTVGGRDAIRIVGSDGRLALVVDAETSKPLEWTSYGDDGTRLTSRFQTYERLPETAQNLALLSLTKQHPTARIRHDATVSGTQGK